MPDPKSKGEEDPKSKGEEGSEGGVLSMEKLVVTEGQDLFPQDVESLTEDLSDLFPKDEESLTEDLSGTNMHTLPQYIFGLVALQKLLLRNCEILMMELPPEIGDLKNLEVLDLEGTEIMCLPMEIAKLVNLTCLKVSFYGYANQTVIPKTVLSNLSRLKELIIDVTPYGEWWDVEVKDIIDDLRNLKELTSLKLSLPTAELLEDLTLILPGLANFRFTVGRHEEHFISRLPRNVEEEFNNQEKLEKGLKFINGNCIPNEITMVLKHANAFFLQRHWTAESLSEFGHENLNEVKFFLVMECNEFRTIIDSEKLYQGKDERAESEDFPDFDEAMVLGSLQRLIIHYMKHMESIWKGPVAKGSLSNLKSLALHTCPKLTTLFTIDMLSYLINLEELIVEDCPKINSLVSHQNSGSKSVLFLPSLKKISLLHLPGLVSISSGQEIAPKLERMVVFYCPKLKLSATEVSSKELKVIKGDKEWWDALKWYESDLSTEDEDYLACLFIPLRKDGDLMAQLTEDEIAGYGQGEVGSFKLLDCLSNFSEEELLEEISSEELEEIPSEELEETPSNPRELEDESDQNDQMLHFDQDVASSAGHMGDTDSSGPSRWPFDQNSEAGGFVHRHPSGVVIATHGRRCRPIAGGAPFVTCYNCLEALQLPKKVRCGGCSTVIHFEAMYREVVSLSMGKRLSANKFGEMASIHSTSPYFSEDVGKIDTLFAQVEKSNCVEPVAESSLSPPAAGSPLQDHFQYSNRYHLVNRFGKGSPSGRSFFGGITTKSFKDSSESNQTIEISSTNVTVNGHPMSDHLLKKAEKLSGPIQPGHYWYDSRAGFWGVMGGPCLGIIPPFIEEFDYPMPKNCAGGNTSVFVNGRELHQKDLNLLFQRGLPTTRDRSYIIEINGRVWDEDSGEELDSLGKLAPTVEKTKRGFGMRVPRVAA